MGRCSTLARRVVAVGATLVCASTHAASVFIGVDNSAFASPSTNADAARNAFLAVAGAVVTQDFEGVDPGDLGALTAGVFANGVGVSVSNTTTALNDGSPGYLRIATGVGSFDTYPTSGRRYLETLSGASSTYFTATFDNLIGALGFDYTDVSDWAGDTSGSIPPLVAVVTFGDGSIQNIDLAGGIAPTSLVSGNRGFVGIVEATLGIRSIAVRSGRAPDGDALGIDDVRVARLSEPTPAALLALAVAGLALSRRRTRPGATCRSSRPG